jgi:hypothetical protein
MGSYVSLTYSIIYATIAYNMYMFAMYSLEQGNKVSGYLSAFLAGWYFMLAATCLVAAATLSTVFSAFDIGMLFVWAVIATVFAYFGSQLKHEQGKPAKVFNAVNTLIANTITTGHSVKTKIVDTREYIADKLTRKHQTATAS